MRAAELLGRTAFDRSGRRLGRVVDIVVCPGGPHGRLRIRGLVVAPHWYGRLIGPDREAAGPWLVSALARLLRHGGFEVPLAELRLDPPVPDL
ncbi:PRC-barrel domain containing protein, partial [Micromonospora zhanjiangensis]